MYSLLDIVTCCLVKNLLVSSALPWILCESRHLLGIGTRLAASSSGEFVQSYSTWTKGEDMSGHSDSLTDNNFQRFPIFVPIFFLFFGFAIILICVCVCIKCQMRQRRLWGNINANPSRPAFEIYPPVNRAPVGSSGTEEVRAHVGINDVPSNYRINDVPSNYRINDVPSNYRINDVPSNYRINDVPSNYRINDVPSNYRINDVPSNYRINDVPPSYRINDVPPNYRTVVEPNTMAPNYNDSLNHYPPVTGGKTLETPPPAYTTVAPFK